MIYILGAGSMARETFNIYKDLNRDEEIVGFIEEDCRQRERKIYGRSLMDASSIDVLPKDSVFIGAMGSPKRKRWIEEIKQKGFVFDTVIHPSVIRGEFVKICEGSIVCPAVVLTCDVSVGQHSIINTNATISHDCIIGDFVTICPGVNIGGNVKIHDECWIGIGATIINNVAIGRASYISAGAVVTQDIADNVLAVGIPAKPVRKLSELDWEKLL
jgi:sugar O-acyltransferase (sialic acid O-acetyltransferase NeuD family)